VLLLGILQNPESLEALSTTLNKALQIAKGQTNSGRVDVGNWYL
jgi:hypothetical protein